MSIVLKFMNLEDFKKAQKTLEKAIDSMASPYFDHSVQLSEKTITILNEKNAEIIEAYFKQNGIKGYVKEKDYSWIGPKACVSKLLRELSSCL